MRLALIRIAGIVLMLVALFFVVGGVVTVFWSDADLDRSGKLFVGSLYAALGLLIASGAWNLLRRSR
jgi:hypothetical protein